MSDRRLAPTAALAGAALAAAATAWSAGAMAHGLDPVGVSIEEGAAGVSVRVDAPARMEGGTQVSVTMPPSCSTSGVAFTETRAGRVSQRLDYHCASPLSGQSVSVNGLPEEVHAWVRVALADGRVQRGVATTAAPGVAVAERPSWSATLSSYVTLGVRHLAGGFDHLFFIVGLTLIARRARAIVAALTAFTLGHSVTLAAATLGWVAFPAALAEVGIALSLLAVAVEVVRRGREGSPASPPLGRAALAAGAMGLLHGLGFATALAATGLPEGEVPLALFGFNAGVEIGQLMVVAGLGLAAAGARRLGWSPRPIQRSVVGHVLGALAAMWLIERVLSVV